MNRQHKRAAALLLAVITADVIAGVIVAAAEHVPVWHGIYCTVGLTTTDGCDIAFHSAATYGVAVIAMVLFVPLWASIFAFFTSGLTTAHMETHLDKVTSEQTRDLKEHVNDTVGSAQAGS